MFLCMALSIRVPFHLGCGSSQDDRKVVALTLAPNEEQLLAALDDGGLWALDLTRLNSLAVCHLSACRTLSRGAGMVQLCWTPASKHLCAGCAYFPFGVQCSRLCRGTTWPSSRNGLQSSRAVSA